MKGGELFERISCKEYRLTEDKCRMFAQQVKSHDSRRSNEHLDFENYFKYLLPLLNEGVVLGDTFQRQLVHQVDLIGVLWWIFIRFVLSGSNPPCLI